MFTSNLKKFFIPHKDNDYAPHSLQKAAMVAMLFLVVLSFAATNVLSLVWISSEWMVSSVLPAVIVELTNEERDTATLGTLTRSSVLDAAAKLKAQDMAKNEYFAHYSPKGVSPWHWFGEVSYNFVHAGENLAIHFTDSGDVVGAWMDSPSHRANIMNGNYTEIGVGTAEGAYEGFKTVYVVQLFGTPEATRVVAQAVPIVRGETTDVSEVVVDTDEQVLSEKVSITENVEIVEAEPVELVVTKEVVSDERVDKTQSMPVTEESIIVEAPQDTAVPQNGVALYSDFISTSTGGIAAIADPTQEQSAVTTPFYLKAATQPHVLLQVLYICIGLFVFIALLLSVFIEIRHQQPMQIVYSVGLLTLMCALFYVHTLLSTGAFIA